MAKQQDKESRVRKLLKQHPEGLTPGFIATTTGINHNTTKSLLRKLDVEGVVRTKQGLRGCYVLVEESGHNILCWKFHNLILTHKLSSPVREKISIKLIQPLSKITFGIGEKTHQATLRFSSKFPRSIQDLETISLLFQHLIEKSKYPVPKIDAIEVRSVEFNRDYHNLKIEGANCITVDGLLTQFKLYNKRNGLREEYKIKVPINLTFMIDLLRSKGDYVCLSKVTDVLQERLETIEKSNERNSNTIKLMFDHIKSDGN